MTLIRMTLKKSALILCFFAFFNPSIHAREITQWDIEQIQKIPDNIRFQGEIRIGIFAYLTGEFAHSGPAEIRGFLMRMAEQNERGGLLGYKLVPVIKDTATDVLRARKIMKEFIAEDMVFVMGGIHSGTVAAASKIAQKQGVIFLNTNSSSPRQVRQDAHRTKFMFDGNSNNFAVGVLKAVLKAYPEGPIISIAKPDDWGRNTVKGIVALVNESQRTLPPELQYFMKDGADMDFREAFALIEKVRPVIVTTGLFGTPLLRLKRMIERANPESPIAKAAWVQNQFDWPEAQRGVVGVGGGTWLANFETPGTQAFVEQYRSRFPDAILPGNVYYNAYFAADALFTAVEKLDTFENIPLIQELETLVIPAEKRMQHHDAYMNPQTHQLQQTIYALKAEPNAKTPLDVLRSISFVSPQEASETVSPEECRLEPLESLPAWPNKSAFIQY